MELVGMETDLLETNTKEGVVEWAVQNSPNRYGVKIEGVWYDGFGELKFGKGELVRIVYEVNDGFHDIVQIEPMEPKEILPNKKGADAPVSSEDAKGMGIVRAVALKAAVCLYQFRSEQDDESVLKTAGRFVEWLGL